MMPCCSRYQVPTWNDIVHNIGETPRNYGLDRCERYRLLVPALERLVSATGVFSTGTNLATELLTENCQIPERVKKYGSNANDICYGKSPGGSTRLPGSD